MRKRKNSHKQQALKRKNFLPTLLTTVFLWSVLGGLVYFIDPGSFGAIFFFFILIFFCLLFTFSLIFANSRRGIVVTIAITFFLTLMYFGVGNILNLILIVAIAVCIELYFSLR
ncbi:MAG: hypothetical protein NTZ07_01100 [Candidatus Woesebacteria bacterium]|nr:hypothetical protein [Candidatus Woesebacteria bacterium]